MSVLLFATKCKRAIQSGMQVTLGNGHSKGAVGSRTCALWHRAGCCDFASTSSTTTPTATSATTTSTATRALSTKRTAPSSAAARCSIIPLTGVLLLLAKYSNAKSQSVWLSRTFCSSNVMLKKRRSPVRSNHEMKSTKTPIDVYEGITVSELAANLGTSVDEVQDALLEVHSQQLRPETPEAIEAQLSGETAVPLPIAVSAMGLFDVRPVVVTHAANKPNSQKSVQDGGDVSKSADLEPLPPLDLSKCVRRPPVVTIMGHVDHGKTTLLDALRHSQIVKSEFGGITQHIGAFSVRLPNVDGGTITFLDTPGHAAFSQMRQRGANVTDLVVLVVAADDGVQEQTVESIKYVRSAAVPMVVAINKIDKPGADPNVVKRGLLEHDVVLEEFGGDVQAVEISALKATNLDALQDAITTLADILELKSTDQGPLEGVVIESKLVPGKGKVCTLLVKRGAAVKGSVFVAGRSYCKVRALTDEHGKALRRVLPGNPVEVIGWKEEMPQPGDTVRQVESEAAAARVVEFRKGKLMEEKADEDWSAIEDERRHAQEQQTLKVATLRASGFRRKKRDKQFRYQKLAQEDTSARLALLLKCDVEGSLEAILDVLDSYHSTGVKLDLVDFGVGPPTSADIAAAAEFNASLYCFNLSVPAALQAEADKHSVPVKHFNVIYRLVADLKQQLSAQLPPAKEIKVVGTGVLLKEFLISDGAKKRQPVAGCLVDEGLFDRKKNFRFLRGGTTVFYDGPVVSLQSGNELVTTAGSNSEVGVLIDDKSVRFEPDDTVECYEEIDVPQQIDWSPPGF